jgi:heme exporter protein B
MSYVHAIRTVLAKDLRTELRNKETLATLLLFGGVLTFVLAFGLSNDPKLNRRIMPGAIWLALLFTGTLGVGRTFAREAEDGAFAALVLSPVPRGAILLAKILVNVLMTLTVIALVLPLLTMLLRVDLTGILGQLTLQLVLGAIGFAVIGTPLAVMAVNARFAEVLLPMVIFPLVVPVLIAGVKGTGVLLGTTFSATDAPTDWVLLMLAFDLVYGVGGLLLFERMVSE